MLSANYTYVEGKIDTKNFSGKDTSFSNLFRKPKNSFNITATFFPLEKVQLRTHLRSVGSFYEPKFGLPPVKLNGYYTIDFFTSYALRKSLKAFIDLKNITDQLYFDQEGFNTRRFTIDGGILINL